MVWNVLEVNFIYYLTRREKMDEGMIFVMIILFAFALPIVFVSIWTSHKNKWLFK
tara:strand:+ start:1466 stop:1630 length:165 start_codon:yes stop_codon:yes gene_type:complete